MRSRLRTCLAAHTTCVRAGYAIFIFRTLSAHRVDPMGRALSSERPRPSRGWVPPSPVGLEELLGRQERHLRRRCAPPC
eukprot:7384197-Prymnesium_polylepis.1